MGRISLRGKCLIVATKLGLASDTSCLQLGRVSFNFCFRGENANEPNKKVDVGLLDDDTGDDAVPDQREDDDDGLSLKRYPACVWTGLCAGIPAC